MAGIDSAALFSERASAFGVQGPLLQLLKDGGYSTFGKLAFCSAYQPGSIDEKPLMDAIEAAIGRPLTPAEAPPVRRLYFEATTMVMADLKSRVERTESTEPRKLPMAERSNRLESQKTRLAGVCITEELEPSHQLVDKIFQQVDDACISWIPWVQLTSRSREAQGSKREVVLKMDASGNLKATQKEDVGENSISGDIRVRQALQRRALAFDLTRIIDYNTMELWTETLFSAMMLEQPSAYRQVSMQQAQDADKKLWSIVSQKTRGKVGVQADGTKPFEVAFRDAMFANEVRFLLQPLPKPNNAPDKEKIKDKKVKKDEKPNKAKPFKLPEGCASHTDDNRPICKNWNEGRCKYAPAGKRCKFGFHLCYKKGCYRAKPHHECTHS